MEIRLPRTWHHEIVFKKEYGNPAVNFNSLCQQLNSLNQAKTQTKTLN
jgi:hypothetical protein